MAPRLEDLIKTAKDAVKDVDDTCMKPMAGSLYELKVPFPGNTTKDLYKQYTTEFDSIKSNLTKGEDASLKADARTKSLNEVIKAVPNFKARCETLINFELLEHIKAILSNCESGLKKIESEKAKRSILKPLRDSWPKEVEE
ncbi:hypothetical protein BD410DRAFT_842870 [Rickenella mellea]|uniref:Uncharacterized protein n=1 Tax=Rickenella mellea TaxID=50990 RepID=A0A4Y7PTK5_9AGAM|nr:hypothetical protein BD410DRAFT_842870 [Rickenella mellea]